MQTDRVFSTISSDYIRSEVSCKTGCTMQVVFKGINEIATKQGLVIFESIPLDIIRETDGSNTSTSCCMLAIKTLKMFSC